MDEAEIDAINILNARLKTMDLAIRALDPAPEYALIDGNQDGGITIPTGRSSRGRPQRQHRGGLHP